MMGLAVQVELANVFAVHGTHDGDASEHGRAAEIGNEDQRLHRGLPFGCILLGLRQPGDVLTDIHQGEKFSAVRQDDRIIER